MLPPMDLLDGQRAVRRLDRPRVPCVVEVIAGRRRGVCEFFVREPGASTDEKHMNRRDRRRRRGEERRNDREERGAGGRAVARPTARGDPRRLAGSADGAHGALRAPGASGARCSREAPGHSRPGGRDRGGRLRPDPSTDGVLLRLVRRPHATSRGSMISAVTGDRDSGPAGRALRLALVIGLLASASAAADAEGRGASDREGATPESAPGPPPSGGSHPAAAPPTRGGDAALPDAEQRVPDPDKLERAPRAPVGLPKPPPASAPPTRGAHPAYPSTEEPVMRESVVIPEPEQNTRVPDPDRLPQAPSRPAPEGAHP